MKIERNSNLPWVTKISENLPASQEIPLFGKAPFFDWSRLSALLSAHFGVQLSLHAREQKWRSPEEVSGGFRGATLIMPLLLSPITSPLFWVMSEKDREKLTNWMVSGHSKGKTLQSEILQEGYYRFLILKALEAMKTLEPIKEFTLQLFDEAPLPLEEAFCIDVELRGSEMNCWGRLIVTNSFRKSWIQHFAQTPFSYRSTHLTEKLPLTLGLKAGSVVLNQQEWNDLEVGDFLLLDQLHYDARKGRGTALLTLGTTPLFQVHLQNEKMKILPHSPNPEAFMQTPNEETLALKDLSLPVVVELGKIQMTLDQLMQLSVGNTLNLPTLPEQGVILTVHGQKVGRGELIALGETLGVRILELGS